MATTFQLVNQPAEAPIDRQSSMPERPTPIPERIAALRTIPSFTDLTDSDLEWIATHVEERRTESGALIFREGEPAHHMNLILEGEIQVRRRHSGPMALFIGRAGQITGKLPYSRMKTYGGDGYTTGRCWALDLHEDLFPEMLRVIPAMGQISVSILLDRVREVTRMEQQAEKLAALGKLAANLAHELNNPASAAQRSAASIFSELRDYGDRKYTLGALALKAETAASLQDWMVEARNAMASYQPDSALPASPMDAVDREATILAWLEKHNVPDAWNVAPAIAESATPLRNLEDFTDRFSDDIVAAAITTYSSALRVERMAQTIVTSTVRIFDLISAIKAYSYMDQAPIQAVDLSQSLEVTLSMFGSRLAGIALETDFDPDLPAVHAYGSELNQVFTALIENALDAMPEGGLLRLSTRRSGAFALIEVWDTGAGVPADLQTRIFEPFFTTKAVGSGLGLGLDIAQRIVSRHSGFLTVASQPGQTCFQIRLPLDQAQAY